jgi:hypothetical protein
VLAKSNYYKPLFWIRVGKDGSIYTSSTYKNPTFSFTAEEPEGSVAFNYDVKTQKITTESAGMRRSKLSFHPSGKIHNALNSGDYYRPFWKHDGMLSLCYIEFENPNHIKNSTLRKNDLVIHVDDKDLLRSSMPITCNILLTSAEVEELEILNDEPEKHFSLIFKKFPDSRKEDMCVHLVFNNLEGDFLPFTGYTFPVIKRKTISYHFNGDGQATIREGND